MYSTTQIMDRLKKDGITVSRPTILNLMQEHKSCIREGKSLYVDEDSFLEYFTNRLDIKKCIEVAQEYGVIFTVPELRNALKHHPKMQPSTNGGKMFIKREDFIEIIKASRNFKDPKENSHG